MMAIFASSAASTFHPPWLIRLWYASPFHMFEPHLFSAIVVVLAIAIVWFFKQGKSKNADLNHSEGKREKEFEQLMLKHDTTIKKIKDLDEAFQSEEVDVATYEKKKNAYQTYLAKVKEQLNDYVK